MAYEGTKAYYDKQAELAKQNADIAYTTAIGELARRYGIANRRLESNLEARGILRSGEANTARTEMTAEEEAQKAAAEMAKTSAYNQADITYAQQLASLMAGSGGSVVVDRNVDAVQAHEPVVKPPVVAYQTPTIAFAGPYGTMVKPTTKPSTARTGTADTMSRSFTPSRPVRVPGRGFGDY